MYIRELLPQAKKGTILKHPSFGNVILREQQLYNVKYPFAPLPICKELFDDCWEIAALDFPLKVPIPFW